MAADRSGRSSTRTRWSGRNGIRRPPHVDPEYFFSGDTIAELARKIANPYQTRPMPAAALQETVTRYNSFVDAGVDADFKRPKPRYKIQTPPFYAAWSTPILHDSLTGLRTNTKAQVIDVQGQVIPWPVLRGRVTRRVRSARPGQNPRLWPYRRPGCRLERRKDVGDPFGRFMATHRAHVEISPPVPPELDAGADIILKVKVSCPQGCDLRGIPVTVMAADGVVITSELATFEETTNDNGGLSPFERLARLASMPGQSSSRDTRTRAPSTRKPVAWLPSRSDLIRPAWPCGTFRLRWS